MSLSEEELLKRAIAGDRDAIKELLELHGPAVRRGLTGKIAKRWQSVLSEDDVMQQSYADALNDIKKFDPTRGSFSSWLSTIAHHNLLDAVKMLERPVRGGDQQKIDPITGLIDILGCTTTTPSRLAERKEIEEVMQGAVKQLPDAYRLAVQMYDLDRKPIEEVAAALERSEGAVYMLRARAIEKLREYLPTASKFFSRLE